LLARRLSSCRASRALVRAACEDEELAVPSPTFLLLQAYDTAAGLPLRHYDLYRLRGPDALGPLDLPAAFEGALSLVEWPERLGHLTPPTRLDVAFGDAPSSAAGPAAEEEEEDGSGVSRPREVTLTAHGAAAAAAAAAVAEYLARAPRDAAPLGGLVLQDRL